MPDNQNGFFFVIEGLDGSGKTEIARRVARLLRQRFKDNVLHTFEPYDPLCAGLFIRQVLTKQLVVSPKTLALAYAVNRADHNDREISPFLDGGERRIVLCDRYYLSSLVYQTPAFSPEEVMILNGGARSPDLTLFLDASAETCYQRMQNRPADPELFDSNLSETRQKYETAIAFLRERGETIIQINADGSIPEVVSAVVDALNQHSPDWLLVHTLSPDALTSPQAFPSNGDLRTSWIEKIDSVVEEIKTYWTQEAPETGENLRSVLLRLKGQVRARVDQMSLDDLGLLFLGYLERLGYRIVARLPATDLLIYEVGHTMPLDVEQRGTALLLGDGQHYDVVMKHADVLLGRSDFMFIFDPTRPTETDTPFGREAIQYPEKGISLSPSTRVITRKEITRFVLADAIGYSYLNAESG